MYEFLYRAISDYVDLYKNKDEDYEYSVPVGAVAQNGTTKVWLDKIFKVNLIEYILVCQVGGVNKILEIQWIGTLLCSSGIWNRNIKVLRLQWEC